MNNTFIDLRAKNDDDQANVTEISRRPREKYERDPTSIAEGKEDREKLRRKADESAKKKKKKPRCSTTTLIYGYLSNVLDRFMNETPRNISVSLAAQS